MARQTLGRAALACALALAALAAAPAHGARPMKEIMADAVKARDAGNLNRTVEFLREAYQAKPAPEILNNLGKILEELGRYREAVDAYQKVADDPNADPQLRSLDTSRIAALQPKLNRAWVLPKITPRDSLVYMDGKLIDMPPGVEFPASHRKHVVLVVHPDERQAELRYAKFPLERRTQFSVDLNKPSPSAATLTIPRGSNPREIRLNGKKLGDGIRRLRALRLPAGTWELEIINAAGEQVSGEIVLSVGSKVAMPLTSEAFAAASAPTETSSIPSGSAALAKPDTVIHASSSTGGSSGLLLPLTGVALGLAGAGVGVGMVLNAASDQRALDAQLDEGQGNQWSVDGNPVQFTTLTYDEAQGRQDEINQANSTGGLLISVGSALLVGSAVWVIFGSDSDAPQDSAAQVVPGVGSLSVVGRF